MALEIIKVRCSTQRLRFGCGRLGEGKLRVYEICQIYSNPNDYQVPGAWLMGFIGCSTNL